MVQLFVGVPSQTYSSVFLEQKTKSEVPGSPHFTQTNIRLFCGPQKWFLWLTDYLPFALHKYLSHCAENNAASNSGYWHLRNRDLCGNFIHFKTIGKPETKKYYFDNCLHVCRKKLNKQKAQKRSVKLPKFITTSRKSVLTAALKALILRNSQLCWHIKFLAKYSYTYLKSLSCWLKSRI